MFTILLWIVYGFIVGTVAKVVFQYAFPTSKMNDITGLYTILLGAAGSYVGGLINFLLGNTPEVISTVGISMGILGAIVALVALHYAQSQGYLDRWTN